MGNRSIILNEPDEATAPERVRRTLEFFRRRNLWYRLARNPSVTSCREAAARRNRLGEQGIPLYDELRSYCGAAYYSDHTRRAVLSHCRASAHFDMDAIARMLGATKSITRVPATELLQMQAGYGTVNPFCEPGNYVQLFDEDLLTRYTPPHTMMTNAGEHTWAVEFNVPEVIEALRSESVEVLVGRIATARAGPKHLPTFGIVTGNGPEAGMALWRNLNDEVRAQCLSRRGFCGDMSYPRVFIESNPDMGVAVDFPERQDVLWHAVEASVTRLCARGATHIAVACHAAHYFADQIRKLVSRAGAEFVSAIDVAEQYLKPSGSDMTILGIPAVASLGAYSGYRSLANLGVHPLDCHAAGCLRQLACLVSSAGSRSSQPGALNRLQHVLRISVSTPKVLVALTEVSILLDHYPRLRDEIGGKSIVDLLRLYGKALADRYIAALPHPTNQL